MSIESYLTTQLKPGEQLVAVVRRHIVLLITPVVVGGLLVALDFFFLAWWFRQDFWGPAGFFVIFLVGVWLITRAVYLWQMNVFGVTSQRVIDIDQRGFFERNVSEAALEKIQDVRYSIRGFWPTVFSYGTVVVQTASSSTTIEADGIHRPVELQRLITDTQQQRPGQPPSANSTPPPVLDIRRRTP